MEFTSKKEEPEVDHAVTAIGYGTDNGKNYWLIRNSWGTDWGEGGYGRLYNDLSEGEDG